MDVRLYPTDQPNRLKARQVLDDAYRALELLELQADLVDARIHYFGMMALLRAVGHVLDKVDCATDYDLECASKRKFKEMKADPDQYEIFFQFIEAERNLILKEYRSNAELVTPVMTVIKLDGTPAAAEEVGSPFPMFIFEDGPFGGEDARDVAPRAIAFWDEYLGELELEVFGESFEQHYPPITKGVTIGPDHHH